MPAMESYRDRPFGQQLIEADQVAGVIGQRERRHQLAHLRHRAARTVTAQPLHQPVDRRGKVRPPLPRVIGKNVQLLVQ